MKKKPVGGYKFSPEALQYDDQNLLKRVDVIRNAMMGSEKEILRLNDRDFKFFNAVRTAYAIVADPNIAEEEQLKVVSRLLDCDKHYATNVIKAVNILVLMPKVVNKEFKRQVVSKHLWEKYLEVRDEDPDLALRLIQEYSRLEDLYTHEISSTDPSTLTLPIPTFSNDATLLEGVEDAEIDME